MGGVTKSVQTLFTDPSKLNIGDVGRTALALGTGSLSELGYAGKRVDDGMKSAARRPGEMLDALLRDQNAQADKQIAESQRIGAKASIVEPINDRNKRLQALRAGMMATLKTSSGAAASKPSLVSPTLTGLALKQKLGA